MKSTLLSDHLLYKVMEPSSVCSHNGYKQSTQYFDIHPNEPLYACRETTIAMRFTAE